MSDIRKVEGYEHLVKDMETKAIINTDRDAYEKAKKRALAAQAQRDEILSLAERCGIKNFGVVKSESFFKFYEELDRSHFQESHIIDDDLFDPELIKMVEKEMLLKEMYLVFQLPTILVHIIASS